MNIPTGEDIFNRYLEKLSSDLADEDPAREKPTEDEAQSEFSDYVYETLSPNFDGVILDEISVAAGAAFDFKQVLDQYP